MPIYEYECSQCAHRVEVLQKISEPPLEDCPACGKSSLKKLVSAASFRLKGTGWYETDFKDKGKPKSAQKQKSTEGAKSDTTTSTPASESKPASGETPKKEDG